jgi:hypothetical protein
MPLLRRQWPGAEPPVAFPGWRIWEDRRVRADNNVMALFAGARIARTSARERGRELDHALVGDLYSDEELPFRNGFRLSLSEALSRWDASIEDLSRMAIVVGVAAIDDLLGSFIDLLRATGHDRSSAGCVDTGVSAKLEHLRNYAGVAVTSDTTKLYGLLVEIRHAVTHYGARQRPVRQAWNRLGEDPQAWWREAAGRNLPLTREGDELRVDDRELLASLKTLDRVALEVSRGVRTTLTDEQWADLIVAEYREVDRARANDPFSNVRRIKQHASSVWRIRITEAGASPAR